MNHSTATVNRPRRPARPAHGTCRLSLTINGVVYAVRPLPCDRPAASRSFRLRKNDGTAYHVGATPHGLVCDCPDFTFSRDGIDPAGCKHIKAMVAVGLLARKGGRS